MAAERGATGCVYIAKSPFCVGDDIWIYYGASNRRTPADATVFLPWQPCGEAAGAVTNITHAAVYQPQRTVSSPRRRSCAAAASYGSTCGHRTGLYAWASLARAS